MSAVVLDAGITVSPPGAADTKPWIASSEFSNKSAKVLKASVSRAGQHLDDAGQGWCHYYNDDTGTLELVQKIMKTMIHAGKD